ELVAGRLRLGHVHHGRRLGGPCPALQDRAARRVQQGGWAADSDDARVRWAYSEAKREKIENFFD
ncbi:MAG: hypothetical protein ACPHL9_13075, partial [Limisphaerales bacterium]